jgi:hypothetical protein
MSDQARIIISSVNNRLAVTCRGVSYQHDGDYDFMNADQVFEFLASIDERATPAISLPGDNPNNEDSWVDLEDACVYFGGDDDDSDFAEEDEPDPALIERMAREIENTGKTVFPDAVGMHVGRFALVLMRLGERLAPNDSLKMETIGHDLHLSREN